MSKFRSDVSRKQNDGATVWCAQWMGGNTIAKIEDCRLVTLEGDMRRTVYATSDADTYFSIPAAVSLGGKRVTGYLTNEDGNLVFRHTFY